MTDRREAIARMAALVGGMTIGAEFFLSGCARPGKKPVTPFSAADIALMDEIGETIIPTTDTPGARAASVGAFMAMVVTDCYDAESHAAFQDGLVTIESTSRQRYGKPFAMCAPADRTALLNELDHEQRAVTQGKTRGDTAHFFKLMKELTLLGYFSSEIGCTKALRYVETPGAYHGDVPYKKGDKGWFNPARRYN